MSDSWHAYPQVYALGHRAVRDLLLDSVLVEEKIDGSQFSFGVFEATEPTLGDPYALRRVLKIRSKGAIINPDCCPKLFEKAVATVLEKLPLLHLGWTYRGEVLDKPKHNALAYSRVPTGNVIIFDINDGEESYLEPLAKGFEAQRLGLECVPQLYLGPVLSEEPIREWLQRESVLGGQKLEGVVIKNYSRFGVDKRVLMGKFVSEAFKEKHAGKLYGRASFGSVIDRLVAVLRTEARWQKGVQHLREQGVLTDSPKDIGPIIKEIHADVLKEEEGWIKDELFKEFKKDVLGGVLRGVAEWYKEKLLADQFLNQHLDAQALAVHSPLLTEEAASASDPANGEGAGLQRSVLAGVEREGGSLDTAEV